MNDRIPSGVFPPLPTFLARDGSLDHEAERRLIARVLDAGVDGVVMLGTSGEGPVLPSFVRRDTLATARDACAGRAPFLVGCVGHTVEQAVAQIEEASEHDAAGVLLLPPFYFKIDQSALARHCAAVARRSPVPVVLYHIPALTGVGFALETVQELSLEPNVVGLKDSDRDLVYHAAVRRVTADAEFVLFQGAAPMLLPGASLGTTDTICPVTALVPDWELRMRAAFADCDLDAAREYADRITAMAGLFNLPGAPMPSNFKAVAEALGLGPSRSHEPLFDASNEAAAIIEARVNELGLEASR